MLFLSFVRVLRQWLDDYVLVNYAGRIIPFDAGIAVRCAFLHVPNPKPDYDAMIGSNSVRTWFDCRHSECTRF